MSKVKAKPGTAPATNGAVPPKSEAPKVSPIKAIQAKFQTARKAMCNALVERDSEVDLVLTALIAHEHCLLIGAPGTGKSLLLDTVMRWVRGNEFNILLTKFTEPAEVLGPTSVAGLKEDKFRRVTTGMLPEAEFAFLDEVFRSSSAILNSLLKLLNERTFQNGTEGVINCPLRLCVAASNDWPNEDNGGAELGALFDRFLFRKEVKSVSPTSGRRSLFNRAVKNQSCKAEFGETITAIELDTASTAAKELPWSNESILALREITNALDAEGITFGDRRFVKAVNAVRAYAFLHGAEQVEPKHLEVLQHVLWNDPVEHPVKAAKIILRLSNPAAVALEEIQAQAESVIDGKIPPAEAVVKLQELLATAATNAGVKEAHGLAHSTEYMKLEEMAKKVAKEPKAAKLVGFLVRSLRYAYSKSIGETVSKPFRSYGMPPKELPVKGISGTYGDEEIDLEEDL